MYDITNQSLEKQKEILLSFNIDELEVIRELLSVVSCGYPRITHYFGCCDANEIIKKIDDHIGEPESDV